MSEINADPLDPVADEDTYTQIVRSTRYAQLQQVNRGLDANPDDAAEAMQLQDLTGTPAVGIMADQDNFKENLRRQSAMQLVLNNPGIQEYLQSHPLAAAVSNDDWANLDKASQDSTALAQLHRLLNAPFEVPSAAIGGALQGFNQATLEAADEQGPFGSMARQWAGEFDRATQPVGYYSTLWAGTMTEPLIRAMTGLVAGATGAATGAGTAVGG